MNSLTTKMFALEAIPGKGKGLVATQDIPKGTRLLAEKPLIKVPQSTDTPEALQLEIADQLRLLSKDEQRAFLYLHNNYPGSLTPFTGIAKTNAVPLGTSSGEGAVFVEISRFNHSCISNCQHTWNSHIGQETVHAVKEIKKGEELTIAYLYQDDTYASRQNNLEKNFDFTCICDLCSLPEADRLASDADLLEIHRLDEGLNNTTRLLNDPELMLEEAHALLLLLRGAYITDARLSRVYYDAYKIVIVHGDVARAKIFAEKAYESRVWCEGADSPQAQFMKGYAEQPKGHGSYRANGKWKSKEKKVPKNMKEEEFEKWLWRMA
ncbi:hypothetical protein MMC18_006958 [Xylographa bjoerkii]|nr:hypothetical protein [Xylographa bjoerkii]